VSLIEKLRPHVKAIEAARAAGDRNALQIIVLYEMHRICPTDPGASALCEATFDDWMCSRASQSTNGERQ
jgi:hypothetical protein